MSSVASDARRTGTAQLRIDWTRCDGHGLCAALLPAAIARDDWGYPILDADRLAHESTGDLRRAANACPALALRLDAGPAKRGVT